MTSGNCLKDSIATITVGNHDIDVSSKERNLYIANEIPEYINRTVWFVVPCNLQQLHLSNMSHIFI